VHDFTTDETYRAKKIEDRFRKAVSQARTPNEVRLARFRLREQKEIALELDLEYPRGHNSNRS
jgi:hypothetical protein